MELKYYTILISPNYGNPYVLVKDWNKENYPFGFSGVNHDGTECISTYKKEVYIKEDVDKEIAELKQKLHDAERKDDLAEWANTEYRKDVKKLKAENEILKGREEVQDDYRGCWLALKCDYDKLKSEIRRKEAVEQRWFEQCMEARSEAIRLKRALWLTRTLRARDIQRWWIAATCAPITERACSVWNNVEHKCLEKAEEYK